MITIRRPNRRTARSIALLAIPAALLLSGSVIAGTSYSAFSSTTANSANSWAVGSVSLTNDSSGTAMFTATGLKPGATGTKCILVTSSGTLPSVVKLYTTGESTTNSVDQYLTLTITQGTGASSSSCTGFTADSTGQIFNNTLANLASTATNFSTGIGTWSPTGTASESKAYKFVWTFSSSAPASTEGGTASTGFTWEADNS